jgi:uncharacterized membrane protein YhaH (DUF805 family)
VNISSELFGDFVTGRLERVRFIVYFVVTFSLVMFFSLLIIWLVLHLLNVDPFLLDETHKDMLLLIPTFITAFFTSNLQAKRFRDMGLPGWLMALLYFSGSLMAEFSEGYFKLLLFGFTLILILLLVFVPSDGFSSKTSY